MTLLWTGLALFFGMHMLPWTPLKAALVSRLGPKGYRGLFTLVSLAGLVLMVVGYRQVPVEYLFAPKPWARAAALHSMPIAFVLLASANMPTHIRSWLKHPMLLGILLWSVLHYFANGERAAVWLFGAFAVYSVLAIVAGIVRGRTLIDPARPPQWKYDLRAVVGGVALYVVVLFAHGWLFNRVLVG